MLSACLGGMAAGLVVDCWAVPPQVLASWCVGSPSLLAAALAHWTLFPAAHGFMLLAALGALPCERRRESVHGGSSPGSPVIALLAAFRLAAMLAGMAVGTQFVPLAMAIGLPAFAAMVLCMSLGMAGAAGLTAAALELSGRVRLHWPHANGPDSLRARRAGSALARALRPPARDRI
jgi:hypothetical protein